MRKGPEVPQFPGGASSGVWKGGRSLSGCIRRQPEREDIDVPVPLGHRGDELLVFESVFKWETRSKRKTAIAVKTFAAAVKTKSERENKNGVSRSCTYRPICM